MITLDARNLTVTAGGRAVLDDVSVTVAQGEMVGLVGPNGAGKSTLVKAILGYHHLRAGQIHCAGRDMMRSAARDRARLIAYVPQAPPEGFPVSVFQTVLMGRTPHMGTRPARRDLAVTEWAIAQLQLDNLAFRSMDALSGGERQRVMLARALAQETPLLVLDEPTSALDIGHQLFALRFLSDLAATGRIGVLVAIHDLSMAARFSTRTVLMQQGRVLAEGAGGAALTPATVRAAYGVDAMVTELNGVPVVLPLAAT
ncbi:ABC transporter ATP-binding protein [Roseinatronobacter alkalisoli]|uniref:ABC transporter ATP-binding protein n=1 Tax=Roseinatronobacter alkalisoli TaxID=3028235 RepID=A0ABT5TEB1_9RHOB|nr:ABC transporter ATP-binding protein [Roseinatronobacter sp. HJB301]MDD7972721.1 ABC transporter ATP-binding protein [Roseinatronobacter sp. HJB301]